MFRALLASCLVLLAPWSRASDFGCPARFTANGGTRPDLCSQIIINPYRGYLNYEQAAEQCTDGGMFLTPYYPELTQFVSRHSPTPSTTLLYRKYCGCPNATSTNLRILKDGNSNRVNDQSEITGALCSVRRYTCNNGDAPMECWSEKRGPATWRSASADCAGDDASLLFAESPGEAYDIYARVRSLDVTLAGIHVGFNPIISHTGGYSMNKFPLPNSLMAPGFYYMGSENRTAYGHASIVTLKDSCVSMPLNDHFNGALIRTRCDSEPLPYYCTRDVRNYDTVNYTITDCSAPIFFTISEKGLKEINVLNPFDDACRFVFHHYLDDENAKIELSFRQDEIVPVDGWKFMVHEDAFHDGSPTSIAAGIRQFNTPVVRLEALRLSENATFTLRVAALPHSSYSPSSYLCLQILMSSPSFLITILIFHSLSSSFLSTSSHPLFPSLLFGPPNHSSCIHISRGTHPSTNPATEASRNHN